tara:strand:- start:599 stop:1072 length:474 start_codon:yes stop_codon:yes gene_type:complete
MSIIPVLGIDPTKTFSDPYKDSFRLGQLGAVIGEPTKLYKYVKIFNTSTTCEAGDVCYYHKFFGEYAGNFVTTDVSLSMEIGAGIAQATASTNDHLWIQIRGPATLSTALTAGADGDPLTPTGAGDKTLDVAASVTDNICAIACDASDKEIICMFPY